TEFKKCVNISGSAVGENSGFTRMRTNKAIWGFPECVLKCRDAGNGGCEVQVETFCEMQNKTT
ncbi:hypothetical protein, partial [Bordetella sp. 02P26C-1]|uniref:hypothetical protein n=1 Tax=Bordetella sp. 02P26C-1 TaxID=2683195 RepID=UPI001F27965E